MGTNASRNADSVAHGGEEVLDQDGGQLYVSLKMENYKRKRDLIPHVCGSVPLVGSWDPSRALPMERESASIWELSFVVPPDHETLDFKFLLKPKESNAMCVIEEGPNRLLKRGTLQGDAKMAIFKLKSNDEGGTDEILEYKVVMKADKVSPFDLAASWRAYQENLQPSTVRGIPDVSINAPPDPSAESGSFASLDLDIEHYVVPAPASANTGLVYAANFTENPRNFSYGVFSNNYGHGGAPYSHKDSGIGSTSRLKEMGIVVQELPRVFTGSGMVESKSAGTFSHLHKQESQRGLLVDRGVGSPRLVKSASANSFTNSLNHDSTSKVFT